MLVSKYDIKLVVPPALISTPNSLRRVQKDNGQATFTFFRVGVDVRRRKYGRKFSH